MRLCVEPLRAQPQSRGGSGAARTSTRSTYCPENAARVACSGSGRPCARPPYAADVSLTATTRGRLTIILAVVVAVMAIVVGVNWWDGNRVAGDAEKAESEAAALLHDLGDSGYPTFLAGEGVGLDHATIFDGVPLEGGGYTLAWQTKGVTATRCIIGTHTADAKVSTRVVSGPCDGVLGDRPPAD